MPVGGPHRENWPALHVGLAWGVGSLERVSRSRAMPVGDRRSIEGRRCWGGFRAHARSGRRVVGAGFALTRDAGRRPALHSARLASFRLPLTADERATARRPAGDSIPSAAASPGTRPTRLPPIPTRPCGRAANYGSSGGSWPASESFTVKLCGQQLCGQHDVLGSCEVIKVVRHGKTFSDSRGRLDGQAHGDRLDPVGDGLRLKVMIAALFSYANGQWWCPPAAKGQQHGSAPAPGVRWLYAARSLRGAMLTPRRAFLQGKEIVVFRGPPRVGGSGSSPITPCRVVDEIGHLPVIRSGGTLFLQRINAVHERASTVLASNKGFEEWGAMLAMR